ncbi:hypothetical protein [Bradyrhizobium yuanmingense]|uniref:hypothetical protein n=1 Tax=Bradyrhizobium yuanmingense TaxID=108015 RepID=UPI0023B8D12B|nr:hypothetical protein [Bradyrhizobium yuanmingense]MDF0579713.1 hypothetical protein [Bradyrhizobium yuanmingense]
MVWSAIADTLRARMPWDVGKRVLERGEIPRSRGWENTLEKLEGEYSEDEETAEYLTRALKEHVACGEKLVRFYRLSNQDIRTLRDAVERIEPASSSFSRAYPNKISDEEIDETYPRRMSLAAVERSRAGTALVYASTRAIQIRHPIDTEELSEEAAEALSEFDEVVGIKLQKYQAMDVVWVPNNGRVMDVRVDFPKGMTTEAAAHVTFGLRERMNAMLNDTDVMARPINLYPLIDRIYRAPDEGNVVELAFGTTTASLKHEKMRRGSSDLRRETYHTGGKRALQTPIEPYRLSVKWSVDIGGVNTRPELSLIGTSRMSGTTNPTVTDAIIRSCAGHRDYEFVRERIEHYLSA